MRDQYSLFLIGVGMSEAVEHHDNEDPEAAQASLAHILNQIAVDVPNTRDVDITLDPTKRLERYRSYRDNPDDMRGIPTGFHTIDRATGGLQPEQLIVTVGLPKVGKSTILLLMAQAAHRQGLRVLNIGFEMSNEQQEERHDAIFSGISNRRLRAGALTKEEWAKLERRLRSLESMPQHIFSSDSRSATTLAGVAGKIEHYRPHVVFIDGVYMMLDEETGERNTPQALTNLTRGFKRMAQNHRVPIVISTQALEWKIDKKRGLTAGAIGYSSSFAQDADTVIGVEATDDPSIQKIKALLSRTSPSIEVFVRWDWDTATFEELEEDPFEDDAHEVTY